MRVPQDSLFVLSAVTFVARLDRPAHLARRGERQLARARASGSNLRMRIFFFPALPMSARADHAGLVRRMRRRTRRPRETSEREDVPAPGNSHSFDVWKNQSASVWVQYRTRRSTRLRRIHQRLDTPCARRFPATLWATCSRWRRAGLVDMIFAAFTRTAGRWSPQAAEGKNVPNSRAPLIQPMAILIGRQPNSPLTGLADRPSIKARRLWGRTAMWCNMWIFLGPANEPRDSCGVVAPRGCGRSVEVAQTSGPLAHPLGAFKAVAAGGASPHQG